MTLFHPTRRRTHYANGETRNGKTQVGVVAERRNAPRVIAGESNQPPGAGRTSPRGQGPPLETPVGG